MGGTTSGQAYVGSFDGTSEYLSLASNTGFDQNGIFTCETWIYPTDVSAGYVWAELSSGFMGLGIGVNGTPGKVIVDVSYVGTKITSTSTITANAWYHVALVYDGTDTKLYINGALEGTSAGGGSASGGAFTIGNYAGGNWYTGYISQFRIVKGVAVYTSAFSVPTTPFAVTQSANTNGNPSAAITGTQTTLLTLQSSTIVDNSTFGRTITNNGTVTTAQSATIPLGGNVQGTFLYDGVLWQSTAIQTTGLTVPVGNLHVSGGSSGYVLSTNGANTLSWIAPSSGATGATGIGATGATGTAGVNGATGASGIQGNIGATGASGIQGNIGATGASGIQGNIGATGASGIQGNIGATGASGIQGNIGATGASGIQGNIGATGVGEIGATGVGATGLQGYIGATGPAGSGGAGSGSNGATGASGIQGDIGSTGASGNIGATGIGATGATGVGASGIQGYTGATGPSGGSAGLSNYPVTMYQAGILTLTTGIQRWYVPFALNISSILARITNVADSSVIVSILKNGSTAATLTISSASTVSSAYTTGIGMILGDYITINITQVGSSSNPGSNLYVQMLYTQV